MDFVLSPDGQNVALTVAKFQIPSNKSAQTHPMAPKPSEVKLIKLDLDKYGSKEGRERLLTRWENESTSAEVAGGPRRSSGPSGNDGTRARPLAGGRVAGLCRAAVERHRGDRAFSRSTGWRLTPERACRACRHPDLPRRAALAAAALRERSRWRLSSGCAAARSHRGAPVDRGGNHRRANVLAVALAIDIGGWTWRPLAGPFGELPGRQLGLGYGAAAVAAASLMFLCRGLALRGWVKGDAFVAGAIGASVTLVSLFTLYPILAPVRASAAGR